MRVILIDSDDARYDKHASVLAAAGCVVETSSTIVEAAHSFVMCHLSDQSRLGELIPSDRIAIPVFCYTGGNPHESLATLIGLREGYPNRFMIRFRPISADSPLVLSDIRELINWLASGQSADSCRLLSPPAALPLLVALYVLCLGYRTARDLDDARMIAETARPSWWTDILGAPGEDYRSALAVECQPLQDNVLADNVTTFVHGLRNDNAVPAERVDALLEALRGCKAWS